MSSENQIPNPQRSSACAACKHQRHRCGPSCQLAPYFPPEKQEEFSNVQRLFGVSNVIKILNKTPRDHHEDAVKSLVFEANMRAKYPVGGCSEVINHLREQIFICQAELQIVARDLAYHRRLRLPQNMNAYDDSYR